MPAMKIASKKIDGNRVFIRSEKVAFREVDGEVLIVPIRMSTSDPTGVYRLNRTASFIWMQLDGRHSVDTIVQHMMERFEVSQTEARSDASELIFDLLSFDAIEEPDSQ